MLLLLLLLLLCFLSNIRYFLSISLFLLSRISELILSLSWLLKMKVLVFFKMSGTTHSPTYGHIPEGLNFHFSFVGFQCWLF